MSNKITFYHPNARGTGSAADFSRVICNDATNGYICVEMAPQMSVGDIRANPPTFPIFDWDNSIAYKLDFVDLCKMLQVFRGETESIEEGRGLYKKDEAGNTFLFKLSHRIEPVCGYLMEIFFKGNDGSEKAMHMILSTAESLGICYAIEQSLARIAFGD